MRNPIYAKPIRLHLLPLFNQADIPLEKAPSSFIYHVGHLPYDRFLSANLNAHAARLLYHAEKGSIALTQKKLGPFTYVYIATKH